MAVTAGAEGGGPAASLSPPGIEGPSPEATGGSVVGVGEHSSDTPAPRGRCSSNFVRASERILVDSGQRLNTSRFSFFSRDRKLCRTHLVDPESVGEGLGMALAFEV